MAKMKPFHSKGRTPRRNVYHDNTLCRIGKTIKRRVAGTDGRAKCPNCKGLK